MTRHPQRYFQQFLSSRHRIALDIVGTRVGALEVMGDFSLTVATATQRIGRRREIFLPT